MTILESTSAGNKLNHPLSLSAKTVILGDVTHCSESIRKRRSASFAGAAMPHSTSQGGPSRLDVFRHWRKIFLHHTCESGKTSIVGLWSLSSAHWNVPALECCLFWPAAPSCGRAFAAESRGPWAVDPTCTHTAEGRLYSTAASGLRWRPVRGCEQAGILASTKDRKKIPPITL